MNPHLIFIMKNNLKKKKKNSRIPRTVPDGREILSLLTSQWLPEPARSLGSVTRCLWDLGSATVRQRSQPGRAHRRAAARKRGARAKPSTLAAAASAADSRGGRTRETLGFPPSGRAGRSVSQYQTQRSTVPSRCTTRAAPESAWGFSWRWRSSRTAHRVHWPCGRQAGSTVAGSTDPMTTVSVAGAGQGGRR